MAKPKGPRRAQDVLTVEVEELCVDLRRAGLSWRVMAEQVTSIMRGRLKAAADADAPRAREEQREPLPARQDWSITYEGCRQAVGRVRERLRAQTAEKATDLRDQELERLDAMLAAIWPKVLGKPSKQGGPEPTPTVQLQAQLVALKISAERRVLTGISAEELGKVGEEGAEVTFRVWTPEGIAKRKAEIAKMAGLDDAPPSPLPSHQSGQKGNTPDPPRPDATAPATSPSPSPQAELARVLRGGTE